MKITIPKLLLLIGVLGASIVSLLNLVAYFAFGQEAAQAVQGEWWAIWFPHYVVWFGFLLIGGTAYLIETP